MNNKTLKTKMPELLAPVGGWPHLTAAVNNGADAVYMGGSLFNARIYAENFTKEDLPEAINYAHAHNVKVYITFNTLLKDSELVRALEYANYLYEIGADALIIQDMGLARLVHKYLPDFPIHLSTQGTVYNPQAVDLAKALGFSRIVPARELSLAEIRELVRKCEEISTDCESSNNSTDNNNQSSGIDVEVFIHGALCMCYSGQCQMSRGLSTKGDSRSGNRGTCAQPCRHAYVDDAGQMSYALSPKDICTIECLPELVESGVASLKIEGRIKTPEYVAIVTRLYRKYLDKYAELLRSNDGNHEVARQAYSVRPQDIMYLKQAFNRGGFTQGYIFGNPAQKILSGTSPKNQGLYLGKVVAIIDNEAKVETREEKAAVRGALKRGRVLVCISVSEGEINMGDGIEFRSDSVEFDVNPIGNVTTYVKNLGSGMYLLGDFDEVNRNTDASSGNTGGKNAALHKKVARLEVGDRVYKVTDRQLLDAAMDRPEKKLPVTFSFTARIGQYLSLVMTDVKSGFSTEIIGDHMVEKAIKAPTEEERIVAQLCRLGDTPYYADANSCDIQLDEGAMVPVSLINRMRRDAVDILLDERINGIKKKRSPLSAGKLDVIASGELLGADKLDFEKFKDSFSTAEFRPVPLEEFMQDPAGLTLEARKCGQKILPYVLNVSKGKLDEFIGKNWDEIVEALKSGADLGKNDRDAGSGIPILLGNLGWIQQFQDAGIKVYADYGLNVFNRQAEKLFEDMGVTVYAPSHESGIADSRGLPLMITEHPIESATLTDRKGAIHKVCASASGDKYLIY